METIVNRIRQILGQHLTTEEVTRAYILASSAYRVSADFGGLVHSDATFTVSFGEDY